MKKTSFFLTLAILPALVFAQANQTKKVSFPAGKSSAYMSGTVKGYQTIDYTVTGNSGQTMAVSLNSKSTAIYFNVLPPDGDAMYIGESDGTNKFSGSLSQSGVYKIRVFLVRSAARRNESANFGLNVSLSGSNAPRQGDAKVPGTKYNATGKIDVALGGAAKGSSTATFGVVRYANGSAKIDVSVKGLIPRKLVFSQGKWSCADNSVTSKHVGDEWEVILNDYEHYFIPVAVITGG